MAGMALALGATLVLAARNSQYGDQRPLAVTLVLIVVAMAVGAVIGAWRARTVEMTGMPELVAMLHSFVGLAAVLVGFNSYLEADHLDGSLGTIHDDSWPGKRLCRWRCWARRVYWPPIYGHCLSRIPASTVSDWCLPRSNRR